MPEFFRSRSLNLEEVTEPDRTEVYTGFAHAPYPIRLEGSPPPLTQEARGGIIAIV